MGHFIPLSGLLSNREAGQWFLGKMPIEYPLHINKLQCYIRRENGRMCSYTYGMPTTAQNKTHSPDDGEETLNSIGDCPRWRADVPAAFTALVFQADYTDQVF